MQKIENAIFFTQSASVLMQFVLFFIISAYFIHCVKISLFEGAKQGPLKRTL